MRIYLPATVPDLRLAHASSRLGGPGLAAHAVTPAMREWYVQGDLEELEYAALTEAAQASLRLLAADPDAPRRRVVLAADVADGAAVPGGPDRSSVVVGVAVGLESVVSIHLDDEDAEAAVAAAVEALPAAARGDDDALFALDEAAAHDLLWYDAAELPDLL